MRVLHSASQLTPPPGIMNQMYWEQVAGEQLGLAWDVRMFCPHGTNYDSPIKVEARFVSAERIGPINKLKAWIGLRREYHEWLRSQYDNYDIFILRYCPHDPFQVRFARQCGKPVLYMHHTLEVAELASPGNVTARIRAFIEQIMGPLSGKVASGLVGVTKEIVDHELHRLQAPDLPFYVYPNGIQYGSAFGVQDRRAPRPEFLFVASHFSPWHGLDRLIDASADSRADYVVHLVGKVGAADLKKASMDPRFVLHGSLGDEQILKLSEQCWIGLSSLAVDRNNLREACTLKAREYLMLGLPVYGGYQEVFAKDFRFYKQGPACMEPILEFARSCRRENKADVSAQSKPHIEKKQLLRTFYEFLEGAFATELAHGTKYARSDSWLDADSTLIPERKCATEYKE